MLVRPFIITIFTILLFYIESTSAIFWGTPSCEKLIDRYEKQHGKHVTPTNISDAFIFFLHVPRTAGKTYAQCFLRAALPPTQRCSPSYDFLRLNVSQENCRYLVSHDDYSVTSLLPKNTLVVTQLRDPVNRVLSSYEFGIEVAARKIRQDDKAFYESNKNYTFVNTMNVWPWSGVIPWFRRDIRAKLAELDTIADASDSPRPRVWTEHFDPKRNRTYYWNTQTHESVWVLPNPNATLDAYSNVLVTPLEDWIETDNARELIHEGATLQILGITNYSMWNGAGELRRCFFEDKTSHRRLLDIAKDRLRSMLHVGLTEELSDSVESLASGLQFNLSSVAYKNVHRDYWSYDAPGFDLDQIITYNASREVPSGQMRSITVREARLLLIDLEKQLKAVSKELDEDEPKLQDLVAKEEEWLDKQEAKKEFWKWPRQVVMKGLEWLKKVFATFRSFPPSVVAQQPEHQQSEEEDYDENEREFLDHIDSPYAEEIEQLDDKVFRNQQKWDALQRDIAELRQNPLVSPPQGTHGRARLLKSEESFKEPVPLGLTYRRCSAHSTKSAAKKRRGAFKELSTPWLESFGFSSDARKNISEHILNRIRELNKADTEIWELGRELLHQALEEQLAAGTLQRLPPPEQSNTTAKSAKNGTVKPSSVSPSPSELSSTTAAAAVSSIASATDQARAQYESASNANDASSRPLKQQRTRHQHQRQEQRPDTSDGAENDHDEL